MTNNRTILVTGGAGYIGSHVCKALAADGFLPVSYDNLSRGHKWAVKWGPLVVGDIEDRVSLKAALQTHQPSAVVHLAAFAYVEESVRNPLLYYRNNLAGSLSLIAAMNECGVTRLVFSSTCTVYGDLDHSPVSEAQAPAPANPYAASKLAVENLIRDCAVGRDFSSVILRYFNAAGCDPDGEIGEAHDPETHLIPLVLLAASGHAGPITINGTDYPTDDGSCVRDYVHVADIAQAHVSAVSHLLDGGEALTLNLSNGKGYSVKQVVETAEQVTGKKIPVRFGPRRLGDSAILVGESTQAETKLGWIPKRSSIEDQIMDAWKWHQKQLA